jgi:hypothetical protein
VTTTTPTTTAWQATVDDAPVAMTTANGLVAVGGAGGTAWILDATAGRPIGTVTLPGGLLDLALSPDGEHLALTGPLSRDPGVGRGERTGRHCFPPRVRRPPAGQGGELDTAPPGSQGVDGCSGLIRMGSEGWGCPVPADTAAGD